MPKRLNAHIELKLSIWKKVDNLYYVEPDDLLAAIADGGTDETERRKRMGVGFKYIQELIDGEHLSISSISFVEHGIMKHEHKPHSPCRY